MITAEEVRRDLYYSPVTGILRWQWRPRERFENDWTWKSWNHRCAGKIAGTIHKLGYRHIKLKDRFWKAHDLAWLHFYGKWAKGVVDHVNCDPDDNRIFKLREATISENACNKRRRKDNTTGFKGVRWVQRRQKFQVRIAKNGVRKTLGHFDTTEEAYMRYCQEAQKLHGEFARLE